MALKNVSFEVREGEIFGIAGVAGNGQRELAEVVMGLLPVQAGQILLRHQALPHPDSRRGLKGDFAYIPEDRLHDGFLPRATVAHNLILGLHRRPPYSNGRVIDWKTVHARALDLIAQYNIKASGPEDMGGNLSGGNIQRVMVARAFSAAAPVLVAHNPTRGLDIPSMDLVYQRLLERKRQGQATLLISEDLDEILELSDRIAVIYEGEIVRVMPADEATPETLGLLMAGMRTRPETKDE
jgi:simple sugar transport system ATP-binding protein